MRPYASLFQYRKFERHSLWEPLTLMTHTVNIIIRTLTVMIWKWNLQHFSFMYIMHSTPDMSQVFFGAFLKDHFSETIDQKSWLTKSLCKFETIQKSWRGISQRQYNYTLSHNYVAQSFSRIIKKIVYLRRFPFQTVLTDSSGDKCHKNHHNNFILL